MVYAVFATENLKKELSKLPQETQTKITKIFLQLKENPYVGDSLKYKFFREKRIKEKRLYYLIYENLSAVLVVAIGGKKTQQKTINHIIYYLSEYKKYMENLFKK